MTTLCAYAYFEYEAVDVAVIEVGMGGTIDATNIMTPVLSIMTNVSLEHVDVLGPTITHITEHKAGIIKPNVPVLIGPLVEEARVVVNKKIQLTQSPLFETLPYTWDNKEGLSVGSYRNLQLRLQGSYQHANVALAIQAITVLQSQFPVDEEAIRQGIASAFIPGRLETIHSSPMIILDGGHNPDGVRVLVEAMHAYRDQPIHILFAAFKDKDVDPMLASLKTIASSMTLTTFDHPRARQRVDYDASFPFTDDYPSFINHFTQNGTTNRVLLVAGSLAFIGLVRQWFIKKRT
jgi:dihydrofolate synthase/folylpolyglutamate synthase